MKAARIIDVMLGLGYPSNVSGVCNGIAWAAERARRNNKFEGLERRVHFIHQQLFFEKKDSKTKLYYNKKLLPNVIKEVYEKVNKNLPLCLDEKILSELKPFCEEVWSYQSPREVQNFLNTTSEKNSTSPDTIFDITNKYRGRLFFNGIWHQSAFKEIDNLLNNREEGSNFSQEMIQQTYFLYTAHILKSHEYYNAFEEFLNLLKQQEKIGLFVSSTNHTLHVFFNFRKNHWQVTNHDILIKFSTTAELVDYINTKAFSFLKTNLYLSLKIMDASPLLLDTLKQISIKSVQSMKIPVGEEPICLLVHMVTGKVDPSIIEVYLNRNPPRVNLVLALYCAIITNHIEIIELLLKYAKEKERNILNLKYGSTEDENNSTPLHLAARFGRKEIVKILVKQPNIEINARDSNKNTPLHNAAILGNKETVELLLNHPDLQINLKNKNEKTALDMALYHSHHPVYADPVYNLLVNRGAFSGSDYKAPFGIMPKKVIESVEEKFSLKY